MRVILAALTAAPILLTGVPAHAEAGPALIDHVEWTDWQGLASLRVYPLPAGRAAAARLGATGDGERAWSEVLAQAPDAGTPGMREQFLCHWQYAELAQPGKTSWNLEPWRPVVDEATMLDAGCNPGAEEEPF
ncbi:DUF2599 domain-containing protein [Mycolicibacillus trivialis]